MKWPEEIEIPNSIGAGKYTYPSGKPCCAIGHYRKAFGASWHDALPLLLTFAFVKCAKYLKPCRHVSVMHINDYELSAKERVLVYAAALAYVGYTLHNFPEAEELARKAKGTK